jgi:hypothetical protein
MFRRILFLSHLPGDVHLHDVFSPVRRCSSESISACRALSNRETDAGAREKLALCGCSRIKKLVNSSSGVTGE